jgi:hypothetical protein
MNPHLDFPLMKNAENCGAGRDFALLLGAVFTNLRLSVTPTTPDLYDCLLFPRNRHSGFGFGFSLILLTAALGQERLRNALRRSRPRPKKQRWKKWRRWGGSARAWGDLQGRATIAIPPGFRFTEGQAPASC